MQSVRTKKKRQLIETGDHAFWAWAWRPMEFSKHFSIEKNISFFPDVLVTLFQNMAGRVNASSLPPLPFVVLKDPVLASAVRLGLKPFGQSNQRIPPKVSWTYLQFQDYFSEFLKHIFIKFSPHYLLRDYVHFPYCYAEGCREHFKKAYERLEAFLHIFSQINTQVFEKVSKDDYSAEYFKAEETRIFCEGLLKEYRERSSELSEGPSDLPSLLINQIDACEGILEIVDTDDNFPKQMEKALTLLKKNVLTLKEWLPNPASSFSARVVLRGVFPNREELESLECLGFQKPYDFEDIQKILDKRFRDLMAFWHSDSFSFVLPAVGGFFSEVERNTLRTRIFGFTEARSKDILRSRKSVQGWMSRCKNPLFLPHGSAPRMNAYHTLLQESIDALTQEIHALKSKKNVLTAHEDLEAQQMIQEFKAMGYSEEEIEIALQQLDSRDRQDEQSLEEWERPWAVQSDDHKEMPLTSSPVSQMNASSTPSSASPKEKEGFFSRLFSFLAFKSVSHAPTCSHPSTPTPSVSSLAVPSVLSNHNRTFAYGAAHGRGSDEPMPVFSSRAVTSAASLPSQVQMAPMSPSLSLSSSAGYVAPDSNAMTDPIPVCVSTPSQVQMAPMSPSLSLSSSAGHAAPDSNAMTDPIPLYILNQSAGSSTPMFSSSLDGPASASFSNLAASSTEVDRGPPEPVLRVPLLWSDKIYPTNW